MFSNGIGAEMERRRRKRNVNFTEKVRVEERGNFWAREPSRTKGVAGWRSPVYRILPELIYAPSKK